MIGMCRILGGPRSASPEPLFPEQHWLTENGLDVTVSGPTNAIDLDLHDVCGDLAMRDPSDYARSPAVANDLDMPGPTDFLSQRSLPRLENPPRSLPSDPMTDVATCESSTASVEQVARADLIGAMSSRPGSVLIQ